MLQLLAEVLQQPALPQDKLLLAKSQVCGPAMPVCVFICVCVCVCGRVRACV